MIDLVCLFSKWGQLISEFFTLKVDLNLEEFHHQKLFPFVKMQKYMRLEDKSRPLL